MRVRIAIAAALLAGAGRLDAVDRTMPVPPPGGWFTCSVTGVHDGDGPIYCAERGPDGKAIKIRLTAIAARELDGSCSRGHPCPAASAAAATAALRGLASGHVLRCRATGTSYARITAWCWRRDGVELNCAMVRSGTALAWPRYDRDRRMCHQASPWQAG